ncbi:hypothetical protein [Nocardioides bizhenqiangii]|uniref:Uncharacterized protein n=1 Tax=Nocardioides bizhenqiangii TaxID=3095076 RepID=A0ABZ0ZTW1_9ACTN|nr:hypothetical protein [Nocardioides sp. HM61]WQQ27657.1 hypothetical protein SHK19_05330 [Nocardioides sp. HM61]
MEAFEQFVSLAMETENLIVSGGHKFPVRLQTRKTMHAEFQTHGFEVDLIGARVDRLVLASVKSYFGSYGVAYHHLNGESAQYAKRYTLLNNLRVRDSVVRQAAERFGYDEGQVEMRLYVGKFANGHEKRVREWCSEQRVAGKPIGLVAARDVVQIVRAVASETQYRDDAVLATMKVLQESGAL